MIAMQVGPRFRSSRCGLLLAAAALLSCSINPATGKRQLSLVSESQEIALGREAHPEILAQFGVYPDRELQEYLQRLGAALAARSERPDLPWTFTLLDDPLVNAFALPGGFIYITRGIMTHLESEAELVGVLGHEIGHVTARHGANQMSKALLAQIGLGIGAVAAPEAAQDYGGIAESLAGLLFLKYGRDDERQADSLGLRYSLRVGYDPDALIGVFETLGRVSAAAGGSSLPGWASTHPAPENRAELIRQQIAESSLSADLRVERQPYLQRLEGMVFGADPRQGFFREERFFHPQLEFELTFPLGWQTQNARQFVAAINDSRDAMVQLTLASQETAQRAAAEFFAQSGVEERRAWRQSIGGFTTVARELEVEDDQGARQLAGYAAWLEHGDNVYQLLGFARGDRIGSVAETLRRSLSSFARLTDREILSVEPMRVQLVRASRSAPLAELEEMRSAISWQQLELINRLDLGEAVRTGATLKRVKGFNPNPPELPHEP